MTATIVVQDSSTLSTHKSSIRSFQRVIFQRRSSPNCAGASDHPQAARYRFLYGSIRPFFVRLMVLRRPSKACFVGGPRWTDGYLY
jgi:hypothetical protein